MYEFSVSHVDRHMVGRRLEEEQIAGLQMIHIYRRDRSALLGRRPRQTDADALVDVPDEAATVEAVRRRAPVTVRCTDQNLCQGRRLRPWSHRGHCGLHVRRLRFHRGRAAATGQRKQQQNGDQMPAHTQRV